MVKEVDIGAGSKADFQLMEEIRSATLNVYLSTNTEHGKEWGRGALPESTSKDLSRPSSQPVNTFHVNRKKSVPETRFEPMTASPHCVVTGANRCVTRPRNTQQRELTLTFT